MRPPEPTAAVAALPHAKITPRVLSFAGVDATDSFLNLHPNLTDTQEREIIAHIRTVARGTPWWVGDFALHYQRKLELLAKSEAEKAKEEKRQPKAQADWADVLAEAWDISAGHIRNAATVAAFFAVSYRHEKLTFRHHVDAMRVAGGVGGSLDKAREWLKKAEAGGWSCADLRENALPPPQSTPPSAPEDNPFLPLDTADKWATQHKEDIKQITPERAANLLVRFQALVEWVDHLRMLTGANIAHINAPHTSRERQ